MLLVPSVVDELVSHDILPSDSLSVSGEPANNRWRNNSAEWDELPLSKISLLFDEVLSDDPLPDDILPSFFCFRT